MNRLLSVCLIVVVIAITPTCKKDEPAAPPPNGGGSQMGSAEFKFELFANGKKVNDSSDYYNFAGDTFSVALFNYYVSNIIMIRSGGQRFIEKESYHIIKHMDSITSFKIKDIPPGEFTRIDFLLGVDSVRNVSGIQSGALDRTNNMFWDWKSGYIYFKMEGEFKTLTQPVKDNYAIHIGGFRKPYSCLQTVSLQLDTTLNVGTAKVPQVIIRVDAGEIFKSPHPIGFDTYYSNLTDEMFMKISENYRDMFSVEKVIN